MQTVHAALDKELYSVAGDRPASADAPEGGAKPGQRVDGATLGAGAIAGITCAGIAVALACIAATVLACARRRRRRRRSAPPRDTRTKSVERDEETAPEPDLKVFSTNGYSTSNAPPGGFTACPGVNADPARPYPPGERKQIAAMLGAHADAQPPRALAGRFFLSREQHHGGQAVVQIARDVHDSLMQYAVKMFIEASAFEMEAEHYRDPVLAKCLPPLIYATGNQDGTERSVDGQFALPPFMVIERGLSLEEWRGGAQRRPVEVLALIESAASLLQTLHDNARVHRDIKPDNLLFLTTSATWRLMDMGICMQTGTRAKAMCTPAYAPPEVVLAAWSKSEVDVQVWCTQSLAWT